MKNTVSYYSLNGFNSRLKESNELEDRLMEIKTHRGRKN